MDVESAEAYINHMHTDKAFHQIVNEGAEDEEASWALLKAHGFEFSMAEFRQAPDEIYAEYDPPLSYLCGFAPTGLSADSFLGNSFIYHL